MCYSSLGIVHWTKPGTGYISLFYVLAVTPGYGRLAMTMTMPMPMPMPIRFILQLTHDTTITKPKLCCTISLLQSLQDEGIRGQIIISTIQSINFNDFSLPLLQLCFYQHFHLILWYMGDSEVSQLRYSDPIFISYRVVYQSWNSKVQEIWQNLMMFFEVPWNLGKSLKFLKFPLESRSLQSLEVWSSQILKWLGPRFGFLLSNSADFVPSLPNVSKVWYPNVGNHYFIIQLRKCIYNQ